MIPTQDMTPYPTFGDNSSRVQPDQAKYAAGFLPGDVVPAEWFNWLLNRGSSATTKLNAGTLSMEQEINNVLTAGNQTPDATVTNQLLTAINYIINQVRLDEQQRPAVGVPTLWLGSKPDWALDFGNGASTKYLWANYPRLNNDKYKNILSTLSGAGWMTAHDASGFYVPDLRGIVPIGYGLNARRTVESTNGGNMASYSRSQNLSHAHGATSSFSSWNFWGRWYDTFRPSTSGAEGMVSVAGSRTGRHTDTSSGTNILFDINFTPAGNVSTTVSADGAAMAKPPTIAVMWIVRFE